VPLIAKSVVLNVLNPVFVAKMTDAADVSVGVSRQAARTKSKGDDDFVFTVFFFIVLFWWIR
jgi:hypothetical protein